MNRYIKTLFVLGLLVVGFAAGQSYFAARYRREAEVSYHRALAEFATHMQALSSELNKAKIAQGEEQRSLIGAAVRRLIYAAQINLGELPLGEVQLERVERLLAQTAAETYAYCAGSDKLPEFHEQIEYVNHELQKMLRSREKEAGLAARARFPLQWAALTALNEGLSELKLPERRGEISGEEISREEAVEIAAQFSRAEGLRFMVTNESLGSVPAYTVEGRDERRHITVEVSRRGGLVLWMTVLQGRDGEEGAYTLEEMAQLAADFLRERGFPSMQVTDVQELNRRALFTFVPLREGILRYAEPVRVQVSADSGAVIGFWATTYHLAQNRPQHQLEVVRSQAWDPAEKIRSGAEILDRKQALIQDQQEREILVERLGVRYQDQYYLIYLNAESGAEEWIVPVKSPQFF